MDFLRMSRMLCFAVCMLLTGVATTIAQVCNPLPSNLVEGHFENCVFTSGACNTLVGLSSGGWHVAAGTPMTALGAGSTGQGIALLSEDNGINTEGAFTCVEIKANTSYILTFDVATSTAWSPGYVTVEATTGLVPQNNPNLCQEPLPIPTTRLAIVSHQTSSTTYQSTAMCFTTGAASFEQLWFYGVYPGSGGATSMVKIDNVKLVENTFDIIIDGKYTAATNLCDGPQTDEIFVQVVNHSSKCEAEQYTVSVLNNGTLLGTSTLTQTEGDQLITTGIDIKTLNFAPTNPSFTPNDCYEIEISKLSSCGCDVTETTTLCIEQCECDFSAVTHFFPALGEKGEFFFTLQAPNSGHTKIITADWDFGDGTSGHGVHVAHRYRPGQFTVCATVYGIDERTGECCQEVICEDFIQYYDLPELFIVPDDDEPVEYLPESELGRQTMHNPDDFSEANAMELYPNPSSNQTTLRYVQVDADVNVSLKLYDTQGRLVQDLLPATSGSVGRHELVVSTQDLNSGVYFIRMERGSEVLTKRLFVNN